MRYKPYPNIFEIRFNFELTLIIVSTPQVMRVFPAGRESVFRKDDPPVLSTGTLT